MTLGHSYANRQQVKALISGEIGDDVFIYVVMKS